MKVIAGVNYIGSNYVGWQYQTGFDSIQGRLQSALSKVATVPIDIHCAGRTDKGVHATGQVIHFDTDVSRPEKGWLKGTNSFLPDDIALHWVKVGDLEPLTDFHARHSAVSRRYIYTIYNQATASAFHANATWEYRPLDADLMHLSAQYLVGEHDFTSFRSSECQSLTPFRCIHHINVKRVKEYVVVEVEANAFLHHMVRNIVGSLILVGAKERKVEWLADILANKNRHAAGPKAKADGLFLSAVTYPDAYQIPSAPKTMIEYLIDAQPESEMTTKQP